MERIIALASPRSRIDFIGKCILLVLTLGAFNFIRDWLSFSDGHDSFLNNLGEAAFVGIPFVVLSLAAIAHMDKLHHKLAHLAATDLLTGLPNRRAFLEEVASLSTDRRCDVLMMVDVDHFKRINDTYGHAVGDICLQQMAKCFREHIRDRDVVARMGGEEFAVLIKEASLEEALPIAERIARGGMVEIQTEANAIQVTTSVGVAVRCGDVSIDDILHQADEALYVAKEDGRARYRIAGDLSSAPPKVLTVA